MSEEVKGDQQQPVRRKKGSCCCCISCGCLLPIVAVLTLLFLLFSCSTRTPLPELDVNDTMSQSIIASQVYVQILQAENAAETAELTVTADQLDSLARIAHYSLALFLKSEKAKGKDIPIDPSGISIKYRDNAVELRAELGHADWQLAAPLFVRAVPYADKLTEGVTVYAARIGAIPMPRAGVEGMVERALEKWREEELFARLRPGIESIRVDDEGSLRIVYRPYLFREYLDQIKSRI